MNIRILICNKDCNQLPETECVSGYAYDDHKTLNYGEPPGINELNYIVKAFQISVGLQTVEKTVKSILTTRHEKISFLAGMEFWVLQRKNSLLENIYMRGLRLEVTMIDYNKGLTVSMQQS